MLELLWQCFSGTFFQVAMELRTAARTDPELRPVLVAAERSLRDRIVAQARKLFGKDVAEHPGLERAIDFTLQFMIGAAMTSVLHEDARLDVLIEDFKTLFPTVLTNAAHQDQENDEGDAMSDLRFDGKVAIVTGAGGGLGRSHALLLASRGAKVVVNDLGGSFTGEGKSGTAADKVVAEIKEKGGEAVANYNSVEDGDQIVKTAIDTWGKIDIVVNNAGILRDVSFAKMSQADWDLVYKVHVLGTFKVTHAAWPYMRDAGYGRIINTSSAAGIYGNFGQANYSMAKLGIHGFTQTLAAEGKKRNIVVNTIAPIAGSRMTETVLPKELLEALKPEYVSALVAKLAHEGTEDTGGLYEVGGGFYAKLRWERAAGKTFRLGRNITPDDVNAAWKDDHELRQVRASRRRRRVDAADHGERRGRPEQGRQPVHRCRRGARLQVSRADVDVRRARRRAVRTRRRRREAIRTNETDLALVYEMSGKGMKVLPSFGVIPAINMMFGLAKQGVTAPGLNFGFDRVLHGEQYTEILRPLPTHAKLTTKATVKSIFDKGKGAIVNTEFVDLRRERRRARQERGHHVRAWCRRLGRRSRPVASRSTSRPIAHPTRWSKRRPARTRRCSIDSPATGTRCTPIRRSRRTSASRSRSSTASRRTASRRARSSTRSHPTQDPRYVEEHPRAVRVDGAAGRDDHHRDVEGRRQGHLPLQEQGEERGLHLERGDRAVEGAAEAEAEGGSACGEGVVGGRDPEQR